MISYFVTKPDGTIVGIGTTVEVLSIVPPDGQLLHIGDVPEGANTYINGVFSTSPKPIAEIKQEALVKRYNLLCASDWTQLPDSPITNKEEWAVYRQQLRDVTEQQGWPTNIVWPIKP